MTRTFPDITPTSARGRRGQARRAQACPAAGAAPDGARRHAPAVATSRKKRSAARRTVWSIGGDANLARFRGTWGIALHCDAARTRLSRVPSVAPARAVPPAPCPRPDWREHRASGSVRRPRAQPRKVKEKRLRLTLLAAVALHFSTPSVQPTSSARTRRALSRVRTGRRRPAARLPQIFELVSIPRRGDLASRGTCEIALRRGARSTSPTCALTKRGHGSIGASSGDVDTAYIEGGLLSARLVASGRRVRLPRRRPMVHLDGAQFRLASRGTWAVRVRRRAEFAALRRPRGEFVAGNAPREFRAARCAASPGLARLLELGASAGSTGCAATSRRGRRRGSPPRPPRHLEAGGLGLLQRSQALDWRGCAVAGAWREGADLQFIAESRHVEPDLLPAPYLHPLGVRRGRARTVVGGTVRLGPFRTLQIDLECADCSSATATAAAPREGRYGRRAAWDVGAETSAAHHKDDAGYWLGRASQAWRRNLLEVTADVMAVI